jgi:hypothetical protein
MNRAAAAPRLVGADAGVADSAHEDTRPCG